ncbi:MAG: phosphoribosylformylglycinamidine cyclo-ligase [Chloroflexi bacterium]|nr:phosphoribosylformylglycinamidine cyclo-ligase [Chloroflexota bacterium]
MTTAGRGAYRRAGVDVEAGERAVELMRRSVEATHAGIAIGGIGGFGSVVPVPAGYREPVLVSSTDGVGTKTAIASAMGRWDTIGLDLVAMCADDVVCLGARPLFFLDYVAVGRIDPEAVATLVAGIARGCKQAGCALAGGETAEHPGLMPDEAFDLAGFCVGVVERERVIDGTAVEAGDVVVGLAASGLHANGFSLVRSLLARYEIDVHRPYQEQLLRSLGDLGRDGAMAAEPELAFASIGDVLLTPTRIYTPAVLAARDRLLEAGHDLRAVAHITGGGLPGNLPRVLPDGLGVRVDPASWPMPSVMRLLGMLDGIADDELRATFNGGIGMALVAAPQAVAPLLAALANAGERAWVIGEVRAVDELGGARYVEGPLERAAV